MNIKTVFRMKDNLRSASGLQKSASGLQRLRLLQRPLIPNLPNNCHPRPRQSFFCVAPSCRRFVEWDLRCLLKAHPRDPQWQGGPRFPKQRIKTHTITYVFVERMCAMTKTTFVNVRVGWFCCFYCSVGLRPCLKRRFSTYLPAIRNAARFCSVLLWRCFATCLCKCWFWLVLLFVLYFGTLATFIWYTACFYTVMLASGVPKRRPPFCF